MEEEEDPVEGHAAVAGHHIEQDQQHQQCHQGGQCMALHAQKPTGEIQHPADGCLGTRGRGNCAGSGGHGVGLLWVLVNRRPELVR